MSRRKTKPPLGSVWRILTHSPRGEAFALLSADYPDPGDGDVRMVGRVPKGDRVPQRTIFDELVIAGVLHVEQMSSNHWWLRAGDLHVDIVIRLGKPVVTWWEDKP